MYLVKIMNYLKSSDRWNCIASSNPLDTKAGIASSTGTICCDCFVRTMEYYKDANVGINRSLVIEPTIVNTRGYREQIAFYVLKYL